jgi:hypothetical protein
MIALRPGKDYADCAITAFLSHGVQQKVEREARAMARLGLREAQGAVGDGEIGSGRNDVEMLALEQHSIRRLAYRHRGVAGQQVNHHAFVGRIEMLDQDEGHAVAGGQRANQLPAGIKTARRGSYADDRKVLRAARSQGAPARSRSGRFGLMRTAS